MGDIKKGNRQFENFSMAFCGTKKAVLLFFVTITRLEDYKWEQQKRGWDKNPTSNIKSEQNQFSGNQNSALFAFRI